MSKKENVDLSQAFTAQNDVMFDQTLLNLVLILLHEGGLPYFIYKGIIFILQVQVHLEVGGELFIEGKRSYFMKNSELGQVLLNDDRFGSYAYGNPHNCAIRSHIFRVLGRGT